MNRYVLRQIKSRDGKSIVTLYRRPDDLLAYEEERELFDADRLNFGYRSAHYWSPTYHSGLFQSEDDAIADAWAKLPWLTATLKH